jgi:hypothetical protein
MALAVRLFTHLSPIHCACCSPVSAYILGMFCAELLLLHVMFYHLRAHSPHALDLRARAPNDTLSVNHYPHLDTRDHVDRYTDLLSSALTATHTRGPECGRCASSIKRRTRNFEGSRALLLMLATVLDTDIVAGPSTR